MSGGLQWVGFTTIVRKEVTRILRIWAGSATCSTSCRDW